VVEADQRRWEWYESAMLTALGSWSPMMKVAQLPEVCGTKLKQGFGLEFDIEVF
jgi:hypothetical protein